MVQKAMKKGACTAGLTTHHLRGFHVKDQGAEIAPEKVGQRKKKGTGTTQEQETGRVRTGEIQ